MKIVNPQRYKKFVAEAQNASFSGWDFSWLDERRIQEEPPWDYRKLVLDHTKGIHSMLDMGTGGGEFLASLAPLPEDTHASESYPPNQVIAARNLEPLGVTVHRFTKYVPLSFEDAYFDLGINRHDDFEPAEVKRILKLGGVFITQQVGGLNNLELNQVLQEKIAFEFMEWGLAPTLIELYEADFVVEIAEKAALKSTFLDIGAVVYYLKAIPWQVEGFDPTTHTDALVKIRNIIEGQGKFDATAHRFIIVAKKKAPKT